MQRPSKPRLDFPLSPNLNGQWWKKVNGRAYYFGSWKDDAKGERALLDWLARKDAILAGIDNMRVAKATTDLTVAEMVKRFLSAKHVNLLAGDLADETFAGYLQELQWFTDVVGAGAKAAAVKPDHFAAYAKHLVSSRKLGVDAQARVIRYVRSLFNYAAGQGWIGAVVFGAGFVPPNTDPEAKAVRRMRAGGGVQEDPIFERHQIDWLVEHATPTFKAMILLGLNCGIGLSDLAKLTWKNIDLETGRLSSHRGKNGIRREAYLWKKTRKALLRIRSLRQNKKAIATHGDDALVFITRKGLPFMRRERIMDGDRVKKIKFSNAISITFGRLVKAAKKDGVKGLEGLSFYNLRHTYRTHADNCLDSRAVDRTMGHATPGMGKRYVRRPFKMFRLKKVAKVVYRCIWPRPKATKPEPAQQEMRIAGDDHAAAA
jgi:integrase